MNRSLQPVFRPQVGRLPSEPLPAFVARVVMLAAGDAAVDDSATGDGDGGYTAMVAGESLAAFCAQKNTLRARTPIPVSVFFYLFRSSLKFNNPLGFRISKRRLAPAHDSSFLFCVFFFASICNPLAPTCTGRSLSMRSCGSRRLHLQTLSRAAATLVPTAASALCLATWSRLRPSSGGCSSSVFRAWRRRSFCSTDCRVLEIGGNSRQFKTLVNPNSHIIK
jgi:hypothetical protein